MERNDSTVYWKKPQTTPAHIKLNDYLVTMFERFLLLLDHDQHSHFSPVAETKKEFAHDLQHLIHLS
jgi:hypothetical protein